MDVRRSLPRRHPWLFTLGVVGALGFAFVAFVIVVFMVALTSGHWG